MEIVYKCIHSNVIHDLYAFAHSVEFFLEIVILDNSVPQNKLFKIPSLVFCWRTQSHRFETT